MKQGSKKLEDEKGETETEEVEEVFWLGVSRLASFHFVKLTYELGYLLQKENTN